MNNKLIKEQMGPENEPKNFQVIIIGAGAAGIGAATILSKQNVPYIVLQARNRVGGRLKTQLLDEVPIDMGGAWIHCYGKNNPLKKYVSQIKIQQAVLKKRCGRVHMDGQEGIEFDENVEQVAHSNSSYFYSVVNKTVSKSKKDLSLYQAAKQFMQGSVEKFNPKEKRCFYLMLNRVQHYEASSIYQLSATNYDYSTDEQRGDFTPLGGYGQFIKKIADKINIKISFQKIVKHIIYDQEKVIVQCSDGSVYTSKKIIVSLPLGVLKKGLVKFTPQLPKQYQQSITKIGVGLMNKIIISFEQNFWGSPYWISVGCNQRGRFSQIYNLSQTDKNILCCFITDDFARKTQNQSDQQIIEEFSDLLKKLFKKQDLKIKGYAISRWGNDQFSLGSYSSFHVGSTPEDSFQFRKSINNRVWFIGQHCYPQKIGTGHGAFKTGEMASEQVLKSLKWVHPILKQPKNFKKVDKK